jgi:ubiquinone/menaquinone biosynthesis C-methylase UbiE
MQMPEDLKQVSKRVSAFYNDVHRVITFPGNSVQSFRTKDITPTHDDIIKDSGVKEGMKVLDSGCGLGAFAFHLASKMNCDVTGITYSEEEFKKAEAFYTNKPIKGKLNFKLVDFHFLRESFSTESFDMVMYNESFEHAYDKEKVLRDSYAILKKNGYLFLKFHFLVWLNAKGREEEFKRSMESETENMRTFNHITMPDFLKMVYEIGFTPLLVKIPDIQFDNYEESMKLVEQCNALIEGFNYTAPGFQVSQCYDILLQKT